MTKIIFILIGSVFLIGVILAFVAPKRISVTNKQFILATKQEVFDQIRFMKNFPNWSPFRVQDPQQQFNITGKDGEIGATYHWVGVKEKSEGSQTITAINGSEHLTIKCNITVPFQSNPVFDYTLVEKDGGIEITQHFDTEMPIPTNIFGMLLGLKSKLSNTNKQGLELLKKVAEKKS